MTHLTKGSSEVADLSVFHLVLVSVNKLECDRGIFITVAKILISKFHRLESVVKLINKILTFVEFYRWATSCRSSVNLKEISSREITLQHVVAGREAVHSEREFNCFFGTFLLVCSNSNKAALLVLFSSRSNKFVLLHLSRLRIFNEST